MRGSAHARVLVSEFPSQLRFPAVRSLQRTLGAHFAHRLTAYGGRGVGRANNVRTHRRHAGVEPERRARVSSRLEGSPLGTPEIEARYVMTNKDAFDLWWEWVDRLTAR
jgi:hypothetical protein